MLRVSRWMVIYRNGGKGTTYTSTCGAVDVDVLQEYIFAVYHSHSPIETMVSIAQATLQVIIPSKHSFLQKPEEQKGDYSPHLTLHKPQSLENTILRILDRNRLRTSLIITSPIDEIIPNLPITIQRPYTPSPPSDPLATKPPR